MSTTARQIQASINQLAQELPEGLIVPSAWLLQRGYSRQLVHKYVEANWLVREGHGAFRRPGPGPSWEQRVYSLQLAQAPAGHVGGSSALWLHGLAHYGSPDEPDRVWFYSAKALPGWARNGSARPALKHFPLTLFTGQQIQSNLGVTERAWGPRRWPLRVSTPERATLELLDEAGSEVTFEYVWDVFTGLTSLSPKRLQPLLEQCARVQVKRLFLALGERQQHGWFARLNTRTIDLGSGKRALVRGGRFDSKYLITLPESWRAIR